MKACLDFSESRNGYFRINLIEGVTAEDLLEMDAEVGLEYVAAEGEGMTLQDDFKEWKNGTVVATIEGMKVTWAEWDDLSISWVK